MIETIEQHRTELSELCRKHRVKTLEIFGSAVSGTFDPARSDLDFLVEFQPLEPGQPFACYFGLLEDLRTLFSRKVDLVVTRAIQSPTFMQTVERSRRVLYAA
jgi:predicted nucleotidyltransferase